MNQSARKPGDTTGKMADSLSVDDPSIPVLTERLTLPPLDLDLEFRLPERPLSVDPSTLPPEPQVPVAGLEPAETDQPGDPTDSLETVVPLDNDDATRLAPRDPVAPEPTPPVEERPNTVTAAPDSVEPPEATETSPRVPTSLLVSNVESLLANPSGTPYREPTEFDLTQSDGIRSNRMEANLREMILLELARRLPAEVDSIVRRHLDGAIEEAIRRFSAEVRIALAGSLREMVDRAVKSELERLSRK